MLNFQFFNTTAIWQKEAQIINGTWKQEDYEVSLLSCWASSSVISVTLLSALAWANEESQNTHSQLFHLLHDCLFPTMPSIACASACDHCACL